MLLLLLLLVVVMVMRIGRGGVQKEVKTDEEDSRSVTGSADSDV